MGYGEGIARQLFREGANVVIMDINEQEGVRLAKELNAHRTSNRAYFIKADVSSHYQLKGSFNGSRKMLSTELL